MVYEAVLFSCRPNSSSLPGSLTVAPILPLTVMTIAMIVFPRTHAPMASFQLNPTAIMEEATSQFDTRISKKAEEDDTSFR